MLGAVNLKKILRREVPLPRSQYEPGAETQCKTNAHLVHYHHWFYVVETSPIGEKNISSGSICLEKLIYSWTPRPNSNGTVSFKMFEIC